MTTLVSDLYFSYTEKLVSTLYKISIIIYIISLLSSKYYFRIYII